LFDDPEVKAAAKKAPVSPVVIGGDVPEPLTQDVIPSFAHVPLTSGKRMHGGGGGGDAVLAKDDKGDAWVVQQHAGDRDHVASEPLANSV